MRFIDEHRDRFGGVEPICRVLTTHDCPIDASTYYKFKKRPASARTVRDEQLKTLIARVHAGIVYVAFAADTFSRRIVSWSAATNKRTPLVLAAVEMGLWQRDRAGRQRNGLIHHSDAGSQSGRQNPRGLSRGTLDLVRGASRRRAAVAQYKHTQDRR